MNTYNQLENSEKEKLRCPICHGYFKFVYTLNMKGNTFECISCGNRCTLKGIELQSLKFFLYPCIAALLFLVTAFIGKLFELQESYAHKLVGLAFTLLGCIFIAWAAKQVLIGVSFRVSKYGIAHLLYRDKDAFRFWSYIAALSSTALCIILVGILFLFIE
jgi:hypothetical protein